MARKEGFELEEAISCGGKCHRFRFFRSFCWYIIAFRAPLYIRLKGENKGGKLGWLPPSTAGSSGDQTHARRRCRFLGVLKAAFCCQGRRGSGTRPAVLLRPVGGLAASFSCQGRRGSGTRPAALLRPVGGLAASFSCQGRRGSGTRPAALLRPVGGLAASFSRRGGEGQAHVRRCCRVLGVLKAIFSRR